MVKIRDEIKNQYDNLGQEIGYGLLMSNDEKALNQILDIIFIQMKNLNEKLTKLLKTQKEK